MSNAIVALVVIALMIIAALTWSQAAFSSLDSAAQSLKQTVETSQEVTRTDITVVDAQTQGIFVEVSVHNAGKIHLAQFANWDVVVQYYDGNGTYHVGSLSYIEGTNPGDNQWAVAGIFSDDSRSQQEVYEPGILNPGEVALLRLKLIPLQGTDTANMVTISSANGVSVSAQFKG